MSEQPRWRKASWMSARRSIPGASLEVIPDAAHLANIERPEAATQAILDHLSPVVREGR